MVQSYGIITQGLQSLCLRTKKMGALLGSGLVLSLLSLSPALAVMEVDITRGNVRAIKIAVPDFKGNSPDSDQIGRKISSIVRMNLNNSGMFESLDPQSFIERGVTANAVPRFADWRVIKAEVLPVGNISVSGGKIQATFRLWDVFSGKQLTGKKFSASTNELRRIAHIISDSIYERLTGEKGYFDSQIIFVDETGDKRRRIKKLAIMDQDGHNMRTLTQGKNLVLTPRFSPTRKEVAYMSYKGGKPSVYLLNVLTGREELVGNFPGMSYAPRFSPDGRHIIFSLQQEGTSNIFTMELSSKRFHPLTRDNSINTSPSFAPDGKRIVFESDRSGNQQLYVMDVSGKGARRISHGEGLYSTPVWSPRGDMIAFTKQYRGRFLIGVMRPDGSGERILTEGYHNEGPTWSPNGRILMFFREGRGANAGPKLFSVDLTGHNEHQIQTPAFASDPSWSPVYK